MKLHLNLLVSVILCFFIASCLAITENESTREWNIFLERTKKTYKSPDEAHRRLAIFTENLRKIKSHNDLFEQGKVTYKMGVTKFTDLTEEEFSQYVNKFKFSQKSGHSKNIFKTSLDLSLPHKIDWSERGAVTNVKDQGHCGSSWAFSATGTMEGQAALQLKQHLFLSEQNLIDCVTEEYGGNGCNGGDIIGAYLYVDYYGIDSEDNYNYHGHQYNCQQKNAVFYVAGYEEVERDEHSLQQATAKVGPISVGIDATNKLQNYISGIFIDDTCSNQTNHAVLVVGYGSEGGLDYWIVKNSWGVNWGEQGYFRLIRNSNACGIATMGSYPLVNL